MADFTYQITGFRPSYTPEVRPRTNRPVFDPSAWEFSGLPEAQIEPSFRENLAASLAVINCAGHDAQSSTVPLATNYGRSAAKMSVCSQVLGGLRKLDALAKTCAGGRLPVSSTRKRYFRFR